MMVQLMKIKTDFFLVNDDTHREFFRCNVATSCLYEMIEPNQYSFVYFNRHYYEKAYYFITRSSYS